MRNTEAGYVVEEKYEVMLLARVSYAGNGIHDHKLLGSIKE